MNRWLSAVGTVAGVVGLLVCLFSGLMRLSGIWSLFGFEMMTLFTAGTGLIVAACFLKLQGIEGPQRQ